MTHNLDPVSIEALSSPTPVLPLFLDEVCFDAGGQRLLHHICLRFDPGPPTVVLGPNGAGKTLLIKLCHGLLRPSAGSVNWGDPIAAARSGAQAMVFQRPVLLRRSAAANIDYVLRIAGLDSAERRKRLTQALEFARMEPLAKRPARVLSGGEQQRLALARAWALRPQVLFLDEPTSNLDPAATRRVEQMIAAISTAGTKVIMSTHDLGQARRLADQVVFLHQGRLVETENADQFFTKQATKSAAAFVAGELLW